MTTNYRRGYELERRVKKILEKRGYFVVRSAGSHSPADLVAMGRFSTGRVNVVLVQCKRGKISKKEESNLRLMAEKLGAGAHAKVWDKGGERLL